MSPRFSASHVLRAFRPGLFHDDVAKPRRNLCTSGEESSPLPSDTLASATPGTFPQLSPHLALNAPVLPCLPRAEQAVPSPCNRSSVTPKM